MVVTFLIGCAVLLVVGCAATRSESPKQQGHNEATAEQARSSEATVSEEVARCAGTRTTKLPRLSEGIFITNDLPSCPNKGGLLSGTDKSDHLAGKDGDDEIRALGGSDWLYGGPGSEMPLFGQEGDDVIYGGPGRDWFLDGNEGEDVIYGGPGNDKELRGAGDGQRDELYCGKGRDTYTADKLDYVDSSCEVKTRATSAMA